MSPAKIVVSIHDLLHGLATASCESRDNLLTVKAEADASISRAASAQLQAIAKASEAFPVISYDDWKSTYKAPFTEILRGFKRRNGESVYAEGSLNSIVSQHGIAVVAFKAGKKPKDTDVLSTFASAMREALPKEKSADGKVLFAPANKGGRKAGAKVSNPDTKAGKVTEYTREGALSYLCDGDKPLMQAVDFLIAKHADKVLALYGEIVKA